MDLTTILALGSKLQYVKRCKTLNLQVKGENVLLDNLEFMCGYLEELEIGQVILKDIKRKIKYLDKKYGENQTIDPSDSSDLSKEAEKWYDYLRDEISSLYLFETQTKGILNYQELIKLSKKQYSQIIEESNWKKMSEIEKNDYSDSETCLLVGASTPSAMIALRGAESSLGKYYEITTEKEKGKKTWRTITQELKNNSEKYGISDTFIGFLDYIGDAKRNFTQHPNATFEQRESMMIFIQVMAMVEDIYQYI